jgi:hypothetical protein
MFAALHRTITLDLASTVMTERRRSDRGRDQLAAARRSRAGRTR